MEHGRVNLEAARAIRKGDVERSLRMQDQAIEGSFYSLENLRSLVSPAYEETYRAILRDIEQYREDFPDADKGTRIYASDVEE
jgi:hypothetical protein